MDDDISSKYMDFMFSNQKYTGKSNLIYKKCKIRYIVCVPFFKISKAKKQNNKSAKHARKSRVGL